MVPTIGVCTLCLWQQTAACSYNRLGHGLSGGSLSQSPQRQEMAFGGGGGPTLCAPLNNGSLFPRQTTLPLGAFLATEPLIPVPSVLSM